MEFPGQEYWSESPFPTPGDPPEPGIEFTSLASPALADGFFTTVPPGNHSVCHHKYMSKPIACTTPKVNPKRWILGGSNVSV